MKLKILLPAEVLLDEEVVKIVAEARDGSFCLEPRHIDFVAALIPGILSFQTKDGREEYFALDEGVLVKCGAEVLVSVQQGVRGPDLGKLRETIEKQFMADDEHQKSARTAVARLEANLVRRFLELGHGYE